MSNDEPNTDFGGADGWGSPAKFGQVYIMTNAIGQFYIGSTNCLDLNVRKARHQMDFEMTFRGASKKRCTAAKLFLHTPVSIVQLKSDYYRDIVELFKDEARCIREHKQNPLCLNVATPFVSKEEQTAARRARENEKVVCTCGCTTSKGNASTHRKTKKHMAWAATQQTTTEYVL